MNLETTVNAKAQRREGAEKQDLGRVAQLNPVQLRIECGGEKSAAVRLATWRLCVRLQLRELG